MLYAFDLYFINVGCVLLLVGFHLCVLNCKYNFKNITTNILQDIITLQFYGGLLIDKKRELFDWTSVV